MTVISTQGWDTVFALRVPAVNAELAHAVARGTTQLPDLDWKSNDGYAALSAAFDAWQVSGTGLVSTGGTVVAMCFPIKSGTLRVDQGTQAVDGITAVGTVNLIPLTDGPTHRLVVDTSRPIKITGLEIKGAEASVSIPNAPVLKNALSQALSEALPRFHHVFAAVDLNSRLGNALPWLAPKAAAFCFIGGTTDRESYLATLCMTDGYIPGNPIPPSSVSAGLIPDDADGAMVVSKPLFVRRMLLPGLQKGFKSQAFELTSDDQGIQKKAHSPAITIRSEPVDLSSLYGVILFSPALATYVVARETLSSGSPRIQGTLTTQIESLSLTEEAGKIRIDAGLLCTVTLASPLPQWDVCTARFTATTMFAMVLKADGTMGFGQGSNPTHTTPEVTPASWVKTGGTVIDWFVTVIGLILATVTAGLALALVVVVQAIIEVLMEFVPELISKDIAEHAGQQAPAGLEALAIASVSPVTWGVQQFRPTSVSLEGDLRFGGDLVYATV